MVFNSKEEKRNAKRLLLFSLHSCTTMLCPHCVALSGLLLDIAVVACFSFCTCLPPLICSLHKKTKPGNLPRLCFVRLMYVTESTFGCYSKTGSRFIIPHRTRHVKGFPETRLEKFYRSLCAPLASCNRLCWILDAWSIFLPTVYFRFIVARFIVPWARVALCFGLFGIRQGICSPGAVKFNTEDLREFWRVALWLLSPIGHPCGITG